MKKKLNLNETFGEPLDVAADWHNKVDAFKGDAPSGAPGELPELSNPYAEICPQCGMMKVEDSCSCSEATVCPKCGMMHVDGSCGCNMMSETPCTATMSLGTGSCTTETEEKTCECGMTQGCGCVHLDEAKDGSHTKAARKKRAKTIAKKYGKRRSTQVGHGVYDWAKAPYAAAQANLMALKGK